MNNVGAKQPEMFSSQWYDEYFRRAASSAAHARFCENVYGKNLCQHGLMDMEELDFLVSLIESGAKLLEVGCSNGYITAYIHEHTNADILALDYSYVAIAQAQARTKDKSRTLRFMRVDLTEDEVPGDDYAYIILIDSIYFLGDFQETIKRLSEKLSPTGKMIITCFDVGEEAVEGGPPPGPDSTSLAQALQQMGVAYDWHDFTENVRAHGIKNFQVGELLKEAFEKEGNQFLYDARAAENRFFKAYAEEEKIVRYMYVVGPFPPV